MELMLEFRTRTQGQSNNVTGEPLNELTTDGCTPTGLSLADLNSPESSAVDFGPFPINRDVQGLEGNAKFLISNLRDGILIHTGEWLGWNPSMPMPNSLGCVHTFPSDCKLIFETLVFLGVEIRNNTNGQLPYPYTPQGILSIEQID